MAVGSWLSGEGVNIFPCFCSSLRLIVKFTIVGSSLLGDIGPLLSDKSTLWTAASPLGHGLVLSQKWFCFHDKPPSFSELMEPVRN